MTRPISSNESLHGAQMSTCGDETGILCTALYALGCCLLCILLEHVPKSRAMARVDKFTLISDDRTKTSNNCF